MKTTLTLLLFSISVFGFSQTEKESFKHTGFFIGLNAGYISGPFLTRLGEDNIQANSVEIETGHIFNILDNDKFQLDLKCNWLSYESYAEKFKDISTLSISIVNRINVLSPGIQARKGNWAMYYNLTPTFMKHHYYFPTIQAYYDTHYETNVFSITHKLGATYQIHKFKFGVEYNFGNSNHYTNRFKIGSTNNSTFQNLDTFEFKFNQFKVLANYIF